MGNARSYGGGLIRLETPSVRLKNIMSYKLKKQGLWQRHSKNPFALGVHAGGNPIWEGK